MTPVKRIEIVLEAAHTPHLLRELREAGVPGWSSIRDVRGFGDRGERSGDELAGVYRNTLTIVACPPEQVDELTRRIAPYLERHGGICLISDATSLSA